MTRSFGHPVTDLHGLSQAVTVFASRAAEKVRKQGSLASQVMVFIRTSPFWQDTQYSRSFAIPLRRFSADTALLVPSALLGLQQIYRPGFKFAKADVMLVDLQSAAIEQRELDLEGDTDSQQGRVRLMSALDSINRCYGKGSIQVASGAHTGQRKDWAMRQEGRIPAYTTCIADIPVARA